MKKEKILVSACLLGNNCKYDGTNNLNKKVIEYLKGRDYKLICPELLAGLPVPRMKMEMLNGNLIRCDGKILNEEMEISKQKIQKIIDEYHPTQAILKSKSPSCGYQKIYDGTFTKSIIDGNGYACEILLKQGIKVLTENDL